MTKQSKATQCNSPGQPEKNWLPQVGFELATFCSLDKCAATCSSMLIYSDVNRLVKGDGEIVEEIVSRERQKTINRVFVHCGFVYHFPLFPRSKQQWGMQCLSNEASATSDIHGTRFITSFHYVMV